MENIHSVNNAFVGLSFESEYDCLQGCYEAMENWLNDNQNLMIGVGAAVLAIEVGDG